MAAQENPTPLRQEKVAVIGSGNIGRSWAMLFASAGYQVALFDQAQAKVEEALRSIEEQLAQLQQGGMLRGGLSSGQQRDRVRAADTLADALAGAFFVQECVFEILDVKRQVLGDIDALVGDDVIIASSTSAMVPSLLSEPLTHRRNFIVTHPTNPPFYARCVELVPAPWTSPDVVESTRRLMEGVGQQPVVLKKEIEGFLVNRIHFAVLAESWRLVKEGVVSAEGLGRCVRSGLGPRYAFLGPFQVAHLNAAGFKDYCEKYGDMIFRVQKSFGPIQHMRDETAKTVHQELLQTFGQMEELEERRRWRFACMAGLAKLKKDLD